MIMFVYNYDTIHVYVYSICIYIIAVLLHYVYTHTLCIPSSDLIGPSNVKTVVFTNSLSTNSISLILISHDTPSHVTSSLPLWNVTTGSGSPFTSHWSDVSVSFNRQLYGGVISNEMILLGTERQRETEKEWSKEEREKWSEGSEGSEGSEEEGGKSDQRERERGKSDEREEWAEGSEEEGRKSDQREEGRKSDQRERGTCIQGTLYLVDIQTTQVLQQDQIYHHQY